MSAVLAGVLSLAGCNMFGRLYSYSDTYVYYVRPGDTLYGIGSDFGVPAEEIIRVNGISDPRALQIGTRLIVPMDPARYVGRTAREANTGGDYAEDREVVRAMLKLPLGEARNYIGRLRWPGRLRGINSDFGWRGRKFHEGIDIKGRRGDPIFAAHSGKVVYAGRRLRGYGNLIALKGEGILTIYAHNNRNRVETGDMVQAGQLIGEIGSTGHTTGPHLHFEVRLTNEDGKYVAVDPKRFFH